MISNMPPLGQARIISRQSSTACVFFITGMRHVMIRIDSDDHVNFCCLGNPDGSVGFLLKARGPQSGIEILGRNWRS